MRVKLVAIAKDEAAYLPEWIFHHLHFGFDHIEVNVNFSSDNTNAVLEKISKKNPVSYQNCEYVLEPDYDYNDSLINPRYLSRNPLQSRAYAKSYRESSGFDYVAFFDVDEYWCPEDFSTNIKDHIIKNGGGGGETEMLTFYWRPKAEEHNSFFSSVVDKGKNHSLQSTQFKSIVKTGLDITMRSEHKFHRKIFNEDKPVFPKGSQSSFIIHRSQRSSKEYLAMLLKGIPEMKQTVYSDKPESGRLKFTRFGFRSKPDPDLDYQFEDRLVDEYHRSFEVFLDECNVQDEVALARDFVEKRANETLDYFLNNSFENTLICKLIRGLRIPEDISEDIFEKFDNKELNDEEVDCIRDAALFLEEHNPAMAKDLMAIVSWLRPASVPRRIRYDIRIKQ